MASELNALAKQFCRESAEDSGRLPMQWRSILMIGARGRIRSPQMLGVIAAYAEQAGWLIAEGSHSVSLTEVGRALVGDAPRPAALPRSESDKSAIKRHNADKKSFSANAAYGSTLFKFEAQHNKSLRTALFVRFLSTDLRCSVALATICAAILSGCAPTVLPAGSAIRPPAIEKSEYVAADGTALQLASWPAAGTAKDAPKAVILGIHGFGDYRNAWEEPAKIWASKGITTYAYDQRGFGSSPTRGRWAGVPTLIDDIRTVAALVRARHRNVPFYLAGESMGGALVLSAANQDKEVDGLILVATALRSRDTLGPFITGGTTFFAYVVPWLPAGPTSIDFRPTDNPETLEKLRNDPLILHNPRVDLGYGLLEAMDAARASAPAIARPYLMLHGLGDRLVPVRSVRSTIELMPRYDDSHLAFYRDGYHMLLRDKRGAMVTEDIVAWIYDKHASLPSGADAERSRPDLAKLWGAKRGF
jgi:acylglycerol lipase